MLGHRISEDILKLRKLFLKVSGETISSSAIYSAQRHPECGGKVGEEFVKWVLFYKAKHGHLPRCPIEGGHKVRDARQLWTPKSKAERLANSRSRLCIVQDDGVSYGKWCEECARPFETVTPERRLCDECWKFICLEMRVDYSALAPALGWNRPKFVRREMRLQKRKFVVWTGNAYEETWAVSEKQAENQVAYRMRQRGAFPVRSQFSVREVD